jgi:hypothetical protein
LGEILSSLPEHLTARSGSNSFTEYPQLGIREHRAFEQYAVTLKNVVWGLKSGYKGENSTKTLWWVFVYLAEFGRTPFL